MKKNLVGIATFSVLFSFIAGCSPVGSFTDNRDDKVYKTVKIGGTVWMAQNLDYEVMNSLCYANKQENCDKFGRLYTWDVAINICPDGWRLPTKEEFDALLDAVGGKDKAGLALKSTTEWEKNAAGNDKYMFAVLPSGYYDGYTEAFVLQGTHAYFWSSTTINMRYLYTLRMNASGVDAYVDGNYEYDAIPVRCVKDYKAVKKS